MQLVQRSIRLYCPRNHHPHLLHLHLRHKFHPKKTAKYVLLVQKMNATTKQLINVLRLMHLLFVQVVGIEEVALWCHGSLVTVAEVIVINVVS